MKIYYHYMVKCHFLLNQSFLYFFLYFFLMKTIVLYPHNVHIYLLDLNIDPEVVNCALKRMKIIGFDGN